jgi:hypothetical protein
MGIFDVPRFEKLPAHINRSFNNIRWAKRKTEQREYEEIRASNFPLCPRAYVIYRRSPTKRRPHYEQKFLSEAATHLGTALHLVLQKWFGLEGFLHGNWVCIRCKLMVQHHTGTPRCEKCGREMIYHEYAISPSPQTPFSGHIDGILVVPDDKNYLIDFKGSSVPAIRDLKNSNKPKESHYLQTNAYAQAVNMAPAHFGLTEKIQKIIIIYVDRGQPWRTWLAMQVPLSAPVYRETIGRVQLARECLQTGKLPRGLCVSPSDEYAKWCPWQTICFSPSIEGLLSDTVEPESRKQKESEQELISLASYLESH